VTELSDAFYMAFGLAAPFWLGGLLYNIGLGAINRAMPQLMVAFIGAPALTLLGLFLILTALPLILKTWSDAVFSLLLEIGTHSL
jgi:flagellar biosynthetic protein FliR